LEALIGRRASLPRRLQKSASLFLTSSHFYVSFDDRRHCCILAFEPTTALSIKNAKWFNAACQYVGGPRDDGKEPESYTTDQWFFPMSLNAPGAQHIPLRVERVRVRIMHDLQPRLIHTWGSLGAAIVVNVPWKWRAAYKMAKAFMVEETANKFQLLVRIANTSPI
jgi:hypothetical protein